MGESIYTYTCECHLDGEPELCEWACGCAPYEPEYDLDGEEEEEDD